MASIENVRLEITRSGLEGVSIVNVTYRVLLTNVERNSSGLRYRETITLYGADDGWCGSDDFLTAQNSSFEVESDGVVDRVVEFAVANSTLDEDNALCGPGDEIYATVFITPELPKGASGKSNEVSGRF